MGASAVDRHPDHWREPLPEPRSLAPYAGLGLRTRPQKLRPTLVWKPSMPVVSPTRSKSLKEWL